MRQNLEDAGVGLLAWCLMTNHIHLIALPERGDSLSVALRRVHGRYAQYYNARHARSGHLWQDRYFACSLGPGHLWAALVYVEMNPVRAKLVERPGDYRWSSAAAHLGKPDASRMVDMEWWMCWMLTALITAMPRSRSSRTSCHRCGLRLPGGLS